MLITILITLLSFNLTPTGGSASCSSTSTKDTIDTINVPTLVELREIERNKYEAHHLKCLVQAILEVESNGGIYLSSKTEDAKGHFQIRRIMVREVNSILVKQGVLKRYVAADRIDFEKSLEMFIIFQLYHNPHLDLETAARMWQGGERGMSKPSTIKYYLKVKRVYERLYAGGQ